MAITTEGLRAVRAGEVTFDAFARETWADWDRMTKYALRRWGQAGRIDIEDARQELLLGAWRAIFSFDPKRSDEKRLAQFVMFGAISSARKRFKKQVEGRCPVLVHVEADVLDGRGNSENPELDTAALGFLEHVLVECSGAPQKRAVKAFAEHGCLRMAAEVLYADPTTRLEHEFVSRQHARREVRLHVERAVRRVERLERRAA